MDKQFPHPFSDLGKKYRSMRRKLPAEVSGIAAAEFKENFRRGGYREDGGIVKWRPRKFNPKGGKRGLLIKSGRLRRSVRPKPTFDEARVISDVPYAKALNEGFKGTVNIKSHYRSLKKKRVKVKSHKRKVDITARPFMITTKPLLEDIEKHVFKELETIFK